MQIELGQHIRSSDGQDIGKLKHLILDPSNGQVKTLVVEKGFFTYKEGKTSDRKLRSQSTGRPWVRPRNVDHVPAW